MTFQHSKLIYLAFLLVSFPIFCFSVHSPPRSPSPVSLEPLNFHDDWNSFLGSDYLGNTLPQHDSLHDSNTHQIRSASVMNKDQSTKGQESNSPLIATTLNPVNQLPKKRNGGRRTTLTIEQRKENARKSVKEWKIAKRIKDPDYAARQERIRRAKRNESLGIIDRKVGRPPKKQQQNKDSSNT